MASRDGTPPPKRVRQASERSPSVTGVRRVAPSSVRSEPSATVPSGPSPSTAPSAPDPQVGEIIGRYELLDLLGRGGAGSVFRARRADDGLEVALKVLAADKLDRERIVRRFFYEARAASMVDHENLVRLVEFIEESQSHRRYAYAMEFVAGESLRERLNREGLLELQSAIRIASSIARGVRALHHAGIIHRDLKPENIMLVDDGSTRILDYGVAKFLDPEVEDADAPGTFVGTPRYMAPEQAAGGGVDHRADLFAIGVLLFEMITGARPHEGDTLKAVVMAKLQGAPRVTVTQDKEILPQELTDVVDACMRLQPDLRPSTTDEVIVALDAGGAVLAAVGPVRLDQLTRRAAGLDTPQPDLTPAPELSSPGRPASAAPSTDEGGELVADDATVEPTPARAGLPSAAFVERGVSAITSAMVRAPGLKMQAGVALSAVFVLSMILYGVFASEEEVLLTPAPATVGNAKSVHVPHVVTLDTAPPGAQVRLDGELIGPAPQTIRLETGQESRLVKVESEGFVSKELRVSRLSATQLQVELDPELPPEAVPDPFAEELAAFAARTASTAEPATADPEPKPPDAAPPKAAEPAKPKPRPHPIRSRRAARVKKSPAKSPQTEPPPVVPNSRLPPAHEIP